MPKHLLNISKTTFKKSKKRLFWTPKWSKWPSQRANFWPKILILEVIYRPFELKIQLKVGILMPKMMPKPLLNNSKTTFKKSKKRLFWTPKWPNHGYQFWKNGQNFTQKCRFWWSWNFFLSRYYTKVWALWVQKQCPNNFKTTSKQLWKKSKFDPKIRPTTTTHHPLNKGHET